MRRPIGFEFFARMTRTRADGRAVTFDIYVRPDYTLFVTLPDGEIVNLPNSNDYRALFARFGVT
jgi:hypothetical protein